MHKGCDAITQFQCLKSKLCIDKSLLCDAANDCEDGSDEDRNSGGACENFQCPVGDSFLCESNQCIDKNWICDGEKDCVGGDDENLDQCKLEPKCPSNKFLCQKSKKCIPKKWQCDLTFDCKTPKVPDDISDELDCGK